MQPRISINITLFCLTIVWHASYSPYSEWNLSSIDLRCTQGITNKRPDWLRTVMPNADAWWLVESCHADAQLWCKTMRTTRQWTGRQSVMRVKQSALTQIGEWMIVGSLLGKAKRGARGLSATNKLRSRCRANCVKLQEQGVEFLSSWYSSNGICSAIRVYDYCFLSIFPEIFQNKGRVAFILVVCTGLGMNWTTGKTTVGKTMWS